MTRIKSKKSLSQLSESRTLEPFRERVHDIHQRMIHKVKDDSKYKSKLDEKLHDK